VAGAAEELERRFVRQDSVRRGRPTPASWRAYHAIRVNLHIQDKTSLTPPCVPSGAYVNVHASSSR
jgi:hypothetical protein